MEDYTKLWGEIPEPEEDWDNVVPKELAKRLILDSVRLEAPKQHSAPLKVVDITIGPEHSTMEENVLYTIKLIQHARKVSNLINHATSKSVLDRESSKSLEDCPPMPLRELTRGTKYKGKFPLHHTEIKETPFTRGDPLHLPHLGKEVTKQILYKSVATICAHAGFDTAMELPLQVLTDVANEFYRKFTILLRCAVDKEYLYGNSGFSDAMERVFHEMGFGSMTSLHDFYQTRVLLYRDQCEARSINLVQQYQTLLSTVEKEAKKVVRLEESEFESDTEDIEGYPHTEEIIQPGSMQWNFIMEALKNYKSSE